jgi:tetratricopeptide (TPR) repeat protein
MARKPLILLTGAISFLMGMCSTPSARSQEPVRFDRAVRNDLFAGFAGDREAFARGMKHAKETLAKNPQHAEAMVWLGTGTFFESGQAFQKGDLPRAGELWEESMRLMDGAVELEPGNVAVRIPRGSAALAASRMVPPEMAAGLIERAASDYQKAYELQKARLVDMGTHPKGELLSGLADIYEQQGEKEKSRAMLETIVKELAGTPYAKRAGKWLSGAELSPQERRCIGCHDQSK